MIDYRGLRIPHTKMGNVTSDDLFGPNEQVIFDFYAANHARYRRAADVGANIGVHSILMARQGWEVRAYEPDPLHLTELKWNVRGNDVHVDLTWAAVSDRDGQAAFIRVVDNLTANHLEGARQSYGPTERIFVPVMDCRPIFEWADFVKVDCEGHEAVIVRALPLDVWRSTDALMEVGSSDNAHAIYDRLAPHVPMWAQKVGWGRVRRLEDVPTHHSEGSLFVGQRLPFPLLHCVEE